MLDLPLQAREARVRGRITNRQCIPMRHLLGSSSWGLVSPTEGVPVVHVSQVRPSEALEPHRRGLLLQVPVGHETWFAAARTEPCSSLHIALQPHCSGLSSSDTPSCSCRWTFPCCIPLCVSLVAFTTTHNVSTSVLTFGGVGGGQVSDRLWTLQW